MPWTPQNHLPSNYLNSCALSNHSRSHILASFHAERPSSPSFSVTFSNKLYIHSSENLIHVYCFMWVLENNFQSINVTYQLNLYIGSFCWFFWARHLNFWCLANNLYELFDSPCHLPFVVLFDHSSSIHRPLWPLVVQSSSPLPLVVDSSRHLQLPLVFGGGSLKKWLKTKSCPILTKFGTRKFSRALISKIASFLRGGIFSGSIVGFWGPLSLSPKFVKIES